LTVQSAANEIPFCTIRLHQSSINKAIYNRPHVDNKNWQRIFNKSSTYITILFLAAQQSLCADRFFQSFYKNYKTSYMLILHYQTDGCIDMLVQVQSSIITQITSGVLSKNYFT